jgi:hypothetical protein
VAEPDKPATDPKPVERPLIMRFAAQSDVGRIRSKNDDSAYVQDAIWPSSPTAWAATRAAMLLLLPLCWT